MTKGLLRTAMLNGIVGPELTVPGAGHQGCAWSRSLAHRLALLVQGELVNGEVKMLLEYVNPLPRSVARGQKYELLDGDWRFELDSEDRGLKEKWYRQHAFSMSARWPGSLEAHLAAGQVSAASWQDSIVAWYERAFVVPEEWGDTAVQLTFGACGYESRVWLNGHALHTVNGEEVHRGGYTSFSYELPAQCLLPVNRLTVRIAHSLDGEIPRGKQESRVYERGGIWYQTISGPVRSVWIEPVERNRLRSRVAVRSELDARRLEVDLTFRIQDPGLYRVRLAVSDPITGGLIKQADFMLPLPAGDKRQWLPLTLAGARLWSPAAPNLYHLKVQLLSPDGAVSEIETRFGLRHIETRGGLIYLNGEPIYLDGILYQPGVSTFEEMRRHMVAMKEVGCNLVRVHIAGIDPRIYELADEMGLLLWVEVPSPHISSQQSRANHWAELKRMLNITGAHPSIVIWSLYNEDWGVQDIATNPEVRAHVARLYEYMRLNVPQVLVVDNDGWNHVSQAGRLQSDLLTAHIYTTEVEKWVHRLDYFAAGQNQGVTVEPIVIGDPFFYEGQVPLVVSEWGGFGFSLYGGPRENGEKAERIRAFKSELRRRGIAGDVYTQATPIEEEVNGLIDPQTGELLVPPGTLNSGQRTAKG
jgi:hypothetical protein